MGRTVLILGGGVGGLVAANCLRSALPRQHRVVLVEREPAFLFAPSLLWLMTGERIAERISRPLPRLERKGIEVVRGEIQRIDAERREAVVDGRSVSGDFLIIALGAEQNPGAIPGLAQAGHNLYTLDGAEALHTALARFAGGRIVVLTAAAAYKCPAAPYEAAMLLESYLRKREIRDRTELEFFAAEPGPMGVAGPDVSKAVAGMLGAKRISYYPEHQVVSADAAAHQLAFSNGVTTSYDLLVYVPPHQAPRVVRESGLTGASGWMTADRHTLETAHARVYALGDVVSIPLALGKPLPKSGVFAHAEAEVVAKNIARAITGKGAPAAFDGVGACFIEAGDGKAGFGNGQFYAEPLPVMQLRPPTRLLHVGKILFEQYWLRRWF